ncbi:MAG: spermidine/putrescine ABC transporter substrate-binding protein [Roseiflexaceae bacterium]
MRFNRSLIILALLVPLLAACGAQTAQNPTAAPAATAGSAATGATPDAPVATAGASGGLPTSAAPTGELQVDRSKLSSELHLFIWTDYIDPAVKEGFEKEYGVKIIEDNYDANEDMLPKVRAGNSGYDIVVPSDYAVQSLVKDNLLEPLDKSLLPNLVHLNPENTDLYFDKGNQYSVPYFWGTTGIAYNKKFFPTAPDSWSVLFDKTSLEPISGKFTMLDDPRETPGAALIFQGKSINDTDTTNLEEAQKLLIDQKPFVSAYDSANVNLKLATEEIVLAHAWSGMTAQAINGIGDKPGNENVAFVIPKEGGAIWQDNLTVLKESPNKYTAFVFINYLLRPDVAALNTDYVLYLTPNKSAEALLSDNTKKIYDSGIWPTEETRSRLQWIERNEQTDTLFSDLWTRVQS